ncbi:hypothetical protein ACQCLI_12650 [Pseudomonas nitroreducens]|uniref:hypothetical protein n=1 Tax=Pseudomonas nitroreducens TaxID=46680 RepID=UPI003D00E412
MAATDPLPALLHRLHLNQLALGAAVEELGIWIEQRGSTKTSDAVRRQLDILEANADFIGEAIVVLMTKTWTTLWSAKRVSPSCHGVRVAVAALLGG